MSANRPIGLAADAMPGLLAARKMPKMPSRIGARLAPNVVQPTTEADLTLRGRYLL